MKIFLPIRTVSEANRRGHWRRHADRIREQRWLTKTYLHGLALPKLPAEITLTRITPHARGFDSDNVASSLKAVRDGVADAYGVDDGSPLYTWKYWQERGKDYGVRIEIAASLAGITPSPAAIGGGE